MSTFLLFYGMKVCEHDLQSIRSDCPAAVSVPKYISSASTDVVQT